MFIRFSVFMHDKTKEQLLKENMGSPEKQDFIELVSTPGYEFLPNITATRFIKTHLPFTLLPPSVMECKSKVSEPQRCSLKKSFSIPQQRHFVANAIIIT